MRMQAGAQDIFGDVSEGVPNPLVPHVHPYPTRYHGPIFNQPQASLPYLVNPYAVPPFSGMGAYSTDGSLAGPADDLDPMANPLAVQQAQAQVQKPPVEPQPFWLTTGYQIVATASMAVSAYHGYKRNNSIGWALWWGLMGSMFPIITPVIAVAEGYAKPLKGK